MTLPPNDLGGYDSDEVPVVELSDDDMVYRDSQGTATVVVNQAAYASDPLKKRSKKKHRKQSSAKPAFKSPNSMYDLPQNFAPLGLAFQGSPGGVSSMVDEPKTPKQIPPFFQVLGAVAGKAKEFFSGPPVPEPAVISSPKAHRKQQSAASPQFYPGMPAPGQFQQKMAYGAYPNFPQPQHQYMGTPYAQNVFPPSPPLLFDQPPPMYYEQEPKKKSKKHSKKKSKKSKSGSNSEGSAPDLTSNLVIALIFLASGMVYMITQNRPVVEGPISAAVDRTLSNLQLGAMAAITCSGAILGWRLFGPGTSSETMNSDDDTASVLSIPAAGTLVNSHSPVLETRDLFNRMNINGPMAPGAPWSNQFVPTPGAFPMGSMPYQGFPGMPDQVYGGPPRMPGFYPNGAHTFPYASGGLGDEDEDSDEEFEYLPAGSLGKYKKMPFYAQRGAGPDSPITGHVKIDGLTPDMLEEEDKPTFYEPMPPLPGMGDQPIEPVLYNAMRAGPDPELLEQTEDKKKQKQKQKGQEASAKKEKKPEKKEKGSKSDERITGTNKKKEQVYSDEFACKPYGPPPKRYRGVNV